VLQRYKKIDQALKEKPNKVPDYLLYFADCFFGEPFGIGV